jgi:dihydroflavonol-4-reductase
MYLVTGATGHIGNVLVKELLARGEQVCALVLPGEDRLPLDGLGIQLIEGNVLEPDTLEHAFKGVQKVFHLASIISIMPGKNDFVRRVNVQGTLNVVQAALHNGVERLIYTSSIHAITRAPQGVTIDENLPFDPRNSAGEYDRSKAEASLAVLEAAHQGLDAVIACPTGVIGPYDYRRSEMGTIILGCMQSKVQWLLHGAYDFVDVRDVARGLLLAGEKGRRGETYILSGERMTYARLAETVHSILGLRPKIHIPISMDLARFAAFFAPFYYRLAHTRPLLTPYALHTFWSNSFISSLKAQQELGYQPRPLKDSLADTIHWFLENKRQVVDYQPI